MTQDHRWLSEEPPDAVRRLESRSPERSISRVDLSGRVLKGPALGSLARVPEAFDIIYSPLARPGQKLTCHVMAREVEAIDRTHAILWWLRREFGLVVDPVEMFDQPHEHTADCGCDLFVQFEMKSLGGIARLRTGESAAATADVECAPCADHGEKGDPAPQTHREWNGTFAAWDSDAERPDQFKLE